jgi:hypothetical protein
MMIQSPPALPPVNAIATVWAEVAPISLDCQRGSRDCFPKDRVGSLPEATVMLAIEPAYRALADWFYAVADS